MFLLWLVQRLISSAVTGSFLRGLLAAWCPRLLADLTHVRRVSEWFPPAILWYGIRRGSVYPRLRDGIWEFAAGLRVPYLFWLGLRGFVGATIWLALPVLMLIGATHLRPAAPGADAGANALLGVAGAVLLALVVL